MTCTPKQLANARRFYHGRHHERLKAERNAYSKQYRLDGRVDRGKKLTLDLKRHGIDAEDYGKLLTAQGGVCAICHKPETHRFKGKIQRLAVDHDHKTGKIRGLLCRNCNIFIGVADESLERLQSAMDYLAQS